MQYNIFSKYSNYSEIISKIGIIFKLQIYVTVNCTQKNIYNRLFLTLSIFIRIIFKMISAYFSHILVKNEKQCKLCSLLNKFDKRDTFKSNTVNNTENYTKSVPLIRSNQGNVSLLSEVIYFIQRMGVSLLSLLSEIPTYPK